MRQIILDTETTGLDPLTGDRVIEVAAVELVNLLPTGIDFHRLVDPERDIPAEASRIHGFTNGDLVGKPKFAEIAAEMLDFLGDAPIVAHNAPFDFGFLDAELLRAGFPKLNRARMIDSLMLAKERYPGMPNSLDALCRRLGVDSSMRSSHNAILDCRLLAEVYLELMGGKQPGLELAASQGGGGAALAAVQPVEWTPRPSPCHWRAPKRTPPSSPPDQGRAVAEAALRRERVMRIVLGVLLGFILGWVGTTAAALTYGEMAHVSQAEGGFAMGAIFFMGPAGGIVGAVLGGFLGARWRRRGWAVAAAATSPHRLAAPRTARLALIDRRAARPRQCAPGTADPTAMTAAQNCRNSRSM